MTTFDAVLVVVLALSAAWGAYLGAYRQVVRLVALVAAIAAPVYLAAPVAHELKGPLDLPYALVLVGAGLSLALLANVLVRLAAWSLARATRRSTKEEETGGALELEAWNRGAGALLSAARTALVMWLVLSAALLVLTPFFDRGFAPTLRGSAAFALVREHNAVGWLLSDRLAMLRRALEPANRPRMLRVFDDERLKEIAQDESLRRALLEGDVLVLARSAPLLSLVSDKDAMEQLRRALARPSSAAE